MELVTILQGLSPAAQAMMAISVFMLVVAIITSRRATRNVCDCIDALARLPRARRASSPEDPPVQDAA
jgi:hypothetical protein